MIMPRRSLKSTNASKMTPPGAIKLKTNLYRMRRSCRTVYRITSHSFILLAYLIIFIILQLINAQEQATTTDTENNIHNGGCDLPLFSPDEEYTTNTQVTDNNVIYQCKSTTMWCSFPGYEPGVGIYWEGAWDEVGPVTGPCVQVDDEAPDALADVFTSGGEEEGEDDESNHFFCGIDWNTVAADCDAVQHCPTGSDGECEAPGASCFGGTSCDASKGHGKHFKYLGLAYTDMRNHLFCASSYDDISTICSVDAWCRDGTCPSGLSCYSNFDCNVQDIVRAVIEEEIEANAIANGEVEDEVIDEEDAGQEDETVEGDHFFCGLNWNTVAADCESAQHCPSGTDDECELFGAVCFGGTSCDASKGHGGMFEFLGLPYADSRNYMFCAENWSDAADQCSVDTWCRDGNCPDGQTCFVVNNCNVQDFVREQLEKDKEALGIIDEVEEKVILDIDDPKRTNFCGMTWGDASNQCSDWCPEGTECPEPQSCFADTNCYYDRDIVPSASPTTYPPTQSPTITYDRPENLSFCGYGWEDAGKCTVERHCPNGDSDCTPPEICYNYLPGCNIVDLMRKLKPTGAPTNEPPTVSPVEATNEPPTVSPVEATNDLPGNIEWFEIDDEGTNNNVELDINNIPAQPTPKPSPGTPPPWVTLKPTSRPTSRRPTKRPQTLTPSYSPSTSVPTYNPTGDPANWLVGLINNEDWVDAQIEKVETKGGDEKMQTNSPVAFPSSTEGTIPSLTVYEPALGSMTFWCGTNQLSAASCRGIPCPGGSANECPVGETCFRTSCSDETLISPVTPTPKPSSNMNNIGIKQNYCSSSRAILDNVCKSAITCNPGEPACPPGTACWGSHMCNGISEPAETAETGANSLEAGTARPTMKPIALTIKPTSVPSKHPIAKTEASKPSNIPELYCASDISALEKSCAIAQSCRSGPCPKGQFCFPFTCQSKANDESVSSQGGKPASTTAEPTNNVPTNRPIASKKPSTTPKHYCASSVAELVERCGLATECTGSSDACGAGQSCFPYDCRQSLDKCPLSFSGYFSVSCKTYYECRNGVVAGPEYSCGVGMAFDKTRKRCVRGDLVDQYCNGLPEGADVSDTSLGSGATQFCPKDFVGIQASADCKEYNWCFSDGSAGPLHVCSEGLKYDINRKKCFDERQIGRNCHSSHWQPSCQGGFVGWQGSTDCMYYAQCLEGGFSGPTRVCDEQTKFDILREKCVDEKQVNSNCYGAPLVELCPGDFVGYQVSADCREYHQCSPDGFPGPTRVCAIGLKFDTARSECVDSEQVNEFCYGKPMSELDKDGQLVKPCPDGFEGFQTSTDCRDYYQCTKGGTMGPSYRCKSDLKFDKVRKKCLAEKKVNQFCYGPQLSDAEIARVEQHESSGASSGMVGKDSGKESNGNPGMAENEGGLDSAEDCPKGFEGWLARGTECKEYYKCANGSMGPTFRCGEGLGYDKGTNECIASHLVNDFCYEYVSSETAGGEDCPRRFEGWLARGTECKEYYKCANGSMGPTFRCGDGLRYDKGTNECIASSLVNDFCYGYAISGASDGGAGTQTNGQNSEVGYTQDTAQEGGPGSDASNLGGAGVSSDNNMFPSTSPTLSNASAIPPWYYQHTVKDSNGETTQFSNIFIWLVPMQGVIVFKYFL